MSSQAISRRRCWLAKLASISRPWNHRRDARIRLAVSVREAPARGRAAPRGRRRRVALGAAPPQAARRAPRSRVCAVQAVRARRHGRREAGAASSLCPQACAGAPPRASTARRSRFLARSDSGAMFPHLLRTTVPAAVVAALSHGARKRARQMPTQPGSPSVSTTAHGFILSLTAAFVAIGARETSPRAGNGGVLGARNALVSGAARRLLVAEVPKLGVALALAHSTGARYVRLGTAS
jgi:hypothetical protein